mgnify:CR=1 FL=1
MKQKSSWGFFRADCLHKSPNPPIERTQQTLLSCIFIVVCPENRIYDQGWAFWTSHKASKIKIGHFYAANYGMNILLIFASLTAYYALELFGTKSVSFWFRVDYGVNDYLQGRSK